MVKKPRVLILDDDLIWVILIESILEKKAKYELRAAHDVRMALRLLAEEGPFNLVLTDYMISGQFSCEDFVNAIRSGETENSLKGTPRNIPIVVVTVISDKQAIYRQTKCQLVITKYELRNIDLVQKLNRLMIEE